MNAETRRILEDRARALARVPTPTRPAGEGIEVLTFSLSAERYAIETRHVIEVARFESYTPLPGTPEHVVGLTNLRGEIVVVFDLRRLLGVPPKGLTDLSRVLVLGRDRAEFGVLADAVHEVARLSAEELLARRAPVERAFLRGVTRDALLVIDGQALLADPRLYVDSDATRRD